MTVEIIVDEPGKPLQIAGRCCRDDIRVGDELEVEGLPTSVVRITGINVYNRWVDCLHTGYTGTVNVVVVAGETPPLDGVLVGNA